MNKALQIEILILIFFIGPFARASVNPHVKLSSMWAYGDVVTDSLVLDTKQNNLRFYCTTMENLPTDSLKFEYMLEGYAARWHPSFAKGWYFYTNLKPGRYVFRARCRYLNGEWGPVFRHPFTIKCPWWLTWWAHIIYLVASLSVTIYIFHLIRERIRLHNRLKVEKITSTFRSEFVIQASRNFRTPLTVIRTTIEKLTNRQNGHLTRTDIQHLRNCSRQLMQMVEELLEYQHIGKEAVVDRKNDVLEMLDIPINSHTVLVIEPDSELADVIRRELLKYMQVRIHTGDHRVVDVARQEVPDVIVIDTDLKEVNAYELLSDIKKYLQTPVILISDFDNKRSLIRAIRSEADDFLSKPFNCEVLAAMIIRNIRLNEAHREKSTEKEIEENNYRLTDTVLSANHIIIEKRADERFLKSLDACITANMSTPHFDVNSLAESMKLSRSQLTNKVKVLRGVTCVEYLRNQRLAHAALLLTSSDMTIPEIMYMVGMQDITNFYRRFREKYDMPPSAYRKLTGF